MGADPAPVAQTFFVDDAVKAFARLDGIVTLIDAKHIEQHLDEEKPEGVENEAIEQVAFADRMLLNKTDLVTESDLDRVEARLREINAFVYQAVHMIFNGNFEEPWGPDEPRQCKLVFIGKNLERESLTASFKACAA